MWKVYAILAGVFAFLTAILAKVAPTDKMSIAFTIYVIDTHLLGEPADS
jgi:hypothetical protein